MEAPELVQVEGRNDDERVTPPERQVEWFFINFEAKRFPLTFAWSSPGVFQKKLRA
jgi:hypothetical protein